MTDWREALRINEEYSITKTRQHPITHELIKSGVLDGFVVDLGCGVGFRAAVAFESSPMKSIIGVDISEYAIDYARREFGKPGLVFRQADLLDLPFENDAFDNGYMTAVIEHIVDTKKLLNGIIRVIKPSGKLFVSVTDNNYHGDPDHKHTFNSQKLHETLTGSGFTIDRLWVREHVIFAIAGVP